MTMHAVVLPGYQQHPTTCIVDGCPADLGIVSNRLVQLQLWKRALRSGPTAIEAYLTRHNPPEMRCRHKPGCPLAELPPVVHASCAVPDDQGRHAVDRLREALQELADARARGDRAAD
jgi:hypothetical protein